MPGERKEEKPPLLPKLENKEGAAPGAPPSQAPHPPHMTSPPHHRELLHQSPAKRNMMTLFWSFSIIYEACELIRKINQS